MINYEILQNSTKYRALQKINKLTKILSLSKIPSDLMALSKNILMIFKFIENLILNLIDIIQTDELNECVRKKIIFLFLSIFNL